MKRYGAGFTIVEILISVVIISLTMVFVLGSFSQGFLYFLKCKDTTRLHKLAQYVVEEERTEVYNPLPPEGAGPGWQTFPRDENRTYRYKIVRTKAGNPAGLMRVDCTIEGPYEPPCLAEVPENWQESWKSPRFLQFNLTTFIARRPFTSTSKTSFRKKPVNGDGSEWVIKHSATGL
jgi:hypothetical protein